MMKLSQKPLTCANLGLAWDFIINDSPESLLHAAYRLIVLAPTKGPHAVYKKYVSPLKTGLQRCHLMLIFCRNPKFNWDFLGTG